MSISINVICKPNQYLASDIRLLFIEENKDNSRNPLSETNFNELLEKIAQYAFEEGRSFERKNPNLS